MSFKGVHIMFDEALLRRIDADPEARTAGRSALVRRAVDEYLERKHESETEIDASYERAYRNKPPFPDEYGPWPTNDMSERAARDRRRRRRGGAKQAAGSAGAALRDRGVRRSTASPQRSAPRTRSGPVPRR